MITPQDIRDKTFEKAIFGGYDMGSVDDFLDKVAGDLAASQKEILVLKAKMKVLVDKIEEYRSNEDALNMALLSAQKLSVQIEAEARHRADVVVAEANTKSQSILGGIASRRSEEEARFSDAQQTTSRFISSVRQLCQQQVQHLDALSVSLSAGGIPGAGASPRAVASPVEPISIDDTVRSIEDSVARIQAEPAPSIDIDGIDGSVKPAVDAAPASRTADEDDDTQLFTFNRNG